jgi:hypothetical protein
MLQNMSWFTACAYAILILLDAIGSLGYTRIELGFDVGRVALLAISCAGPALRRTIIHL